MWGYSTIVCSYMFVYDVFFYTIKSTFLYLEKTYVDIQKQRVFLFLLHARQKSKPQTSIILTPWTVTTGLLKQWLPGRQPPFLLGGRSAPWFGNKTSGSASHLHFTSSLLQFKTALLDKIGTSSIPKWTEITQSRNLADNQRIAR